MLPTVCQRPCFSLSLAMGKNYTQISGFYLYVSTARYRNGATMFHFRDYAPIADIRYQKLTEEEKNKWKKRAIQLRVEDEGKAFKMTDKLFKTTKDFKMMEAREKWVKKMVKKCWDLSL